MLFPLSWYHLLQKQMCRFRVQMHSVSTCGRCTGSRLRYKSMHLLFAVIIACTGNCTRWLSRYSHRRCTARQLLRSWICPSRHCLIFWGCLMASHCYVPLLLLVSCCKFVKETRSLGGAQISILPIGRISTTTFWLTIGLERLLWRQGGYLTVIWPMARDQSIRQGGYILTHLSYDFWAVLCWRRGLNAIMCRLNDAFVYNYYFTELERLLWRQLGYIMVIWPMEWD